MVNQQDKMVYLYDRCTVDIGDKCATTQLARVTAAPKLLDVAKLSRKGKCTRLKRFVRVRSDARTSHFQRAYL